MKTLKEISQEFASCPSGQLAVLYAHYADDKRKSVQNLIVKYQKKEADEAREIKRLEGMKEYEKKYSQYSYIAGIDEAGRGPLAGPVVASAVILPKDSQILYLNDSKQLSAKRREELYDIIMEEAISVGVGIIGPKRIDEINILQATYEAMRMAISQLTVKPDLLLNDAVKIPGVRIPQVPIVKGDAKSISIAAASVIAKVTRDHMMEEYDALFPEYGFAGHKGYGSQAHIEALKQYGPCVIHRRSFIGHFVSDDVGGEEK
ncbi:MAG: ribonuclease HII [Lachnospiraceae bacterium]